MKKLLSLLLITLFSNLTIAQTTAIPDPAFEQYLIDLGKDNVLDGVVLTSSIDTIEYLQFAGDSISDLTGIEDFTALTRLTCLGTQLTTLDLSQNTALNNLWCAGNNQLTTLDVTQNTALIIFDCGDNQLTTIDVSQNTALERFGCSNNQLTSLDVSQNTALTHLGCHWNQLTSLDLSQNTALETLVCHDNQLTCLNVKNGNNNNINIHPSLGAEFLAYNNPNLTCIEVDAATYATATWPQIDTTSYFSTNCNNGCSAVGIGEIAITTVSMHPNPSNGLFNIDIDLSSFKGLSIEIYNTTGQLILQKTLAENVTQVDLTKHSKGMYFIKVETNNKTIIKKIVYQ
jgi:hypothetical protein